MKDKNLFQKLNAYLKDYDNSTRGLDSYPHSFSTSLEKSVLIAEDIILLKNHQRKTEKQISLLEKISDRIETYLSVGHAFSKNHRKELIQLYEDVGKAYDEGKETGNLKQLLRNLRGNITIISNLLQNNVNIYPVHINNLYNMVKALESRGIDFGELKDKVSKIKDLYWSIFKGKK